jgi:hypothetical protein
VSSRNEAANQTNRRAFMEGTGAGHDVGSVAKQPLVIWVKCITFAHPLC